jgi:hypothetical protein
VLWFLAAMAEPDAKKLKTGKEDSDKAEDVEKKEPELPVEHEKDAPTAKVPTIGKEHTVHFRTHDTTLNVLQGTTPGVLKALSDGGLKFLLAGARASAAAKAGRYMFECRILEYVHPQDDHRQRHPGPTQVFRVGFSTASSCLLLGQDEQSISFDMDGTILYNKKKSPGGSKFGRDDYASVVLNLDSKSPNFQTISLFVNGVRASQPHPLPEKLKGVHLFPHVSFKNLTVHVNFGPTSCKSLPFTCKTIQELSSKDSVLSATPPELKDGKSEILFPVCLPDEGTFDWLDEFLRQNPHYVELSDRMIVEWATRSDVVLKKSDFKSNDKPEVSFNLHGLEDNSVRRLLNAVALLQPRHLVCMEVRRNLLKDERAKLLDAFPSSCFVRNATVVMGEPHSDFVKLTHAKMLQAKQEKADVAFKQQKQEEQRKKLLAKRQRRSKSRRRK